MIVLSMHYNFDCGLGFAVVWDSQESRCVSQPFGNEDRTSGVASNQS
jgi:hypothetical protein